MYVYVMLLDVHVLDVLLLVGCGVDQPSTPGNRQASNCQQLANESSLACAAELRLCYSHVAATFGVFTDTFTFLRFTGCVLQVVPAG